MFDTIPVRTLRLTFVPHTDYFRTMGMEGSGGMPEDFYVYQECGTPVSEHEMDNTKRQWAYVKWGLGD